MAVEEDLLTLINATGDSDPFAEDVADTLAEGPVTIDQPLSSETANYVNALNRETYGDDVELITTKKNLELVNKAAAISKSLEDFDTSVERDVESVAKGTLTPRQMQLNALTRAQNIIYAEDNGDYGLALENMDQLTMNAAITNPDIQAENETFTAQYNRILTNKNILMQARKELVPYGLAENLMAPGAAIAGAIYGPKGSFEKEAQKAEGFLANLAQLAWISFPFYTDYIRASALPDNVPVSAIPHVNELAMFAYWQDAIDKDSNEQFRKRLSDYVHNLKERGWMDTEIDLALESITNPSPILADLGFTFDLAWLLPRLGPIGRMSGEAYRALFKALKGTNKEAASKLLDTLAKGSKAGEIDLKQVEKAVLSVQDDLRRAELVGDTKPQSSVNLNPQIPGVDITEIKADRVAAAAVDDGKVAGVGVEVGFNERTYIPPMKRAETLEEFLASKPSKEMVELPEDLSTELGRLKAARDIKSAEQSLKNTVATTDRDAGTIRVISNDYFESTAKGTVTKDNLARLGGIIDEKNYKIALQNAVNMLEAIGKKGLSGRRAELIENAVHETANSLDAQNNLYRSTGISDILRSHYSDVIQEESNTGDLFALIRSNKKYKTREAADKARKALAAPESWSMPLPDGKWGVDVKIPLNGGFGTFARKEARNPVDDFVRHPGFSSVFTTTSKPTYVRDLDELRELEASQIQDFGDSIRKLVKSIKGEDKPILDAMMTTSRETGSFYDPSQVMSKLKTDKARQAYNGYRLWNDLNHVLINQQRRDAIVKGGWKAMKFNEESLGYSKIIRDTPAGTLSKMETTNRRIIVGTPDAEPLKFKNITMTREAIEKKLEDGWVLVERSYGPDEFTQASSVYYFLDGHQLVENDIPQIVSHYVAGGRRFFDRMATYAKQLDIRTDEQGVSHIVGVKTIAADLDSIGFSNKVGKINAIRREVAQSYPFVNEKKVSEMIEKANLGDAPFQNASTFIEWMKKHGIDFKNVDNNIEAVADGKVLDSLNSLRKTFDLSIDEDEIGRVMHRSAYQAYNKEFQIQQWHRSGKDLLGWNLQDLVEPVDFDKNMRYMTQDMVNARVMSGYQDMMANDFYHRWGKNVKNGDTMTAKQMLNSVHKLKDFNGDRGEALKALIFAENYRAVRGTPTGVDAAIAENFDAVLKSLNASLPPGFDEIAHGARLTAAKVKEWGPLHQQRHLTSTVMMGLMRTKQLITQIAPITYTFMLKPTSTIKSLKTVFPMTVEMITSKGSWSKATERFLKSEKLYTPETKAMWEALKDARIFENTPYAGAFEMADATSKWSKFDRIQFAPKNFGEIFNRVLAHTVAYHELGYGAKGITSAKEMAAFRSLGNTLYMNMSPTGLSRIQNTELMKTLIQFKSANLRFWETMLFDRNLTKAERLRLGISLAAIGGMRTFIGVEGSRAVLNTIDDAINYFSPETLEGQPSRLLEEEPVIKRISDAGLLGYISGSDGYDWGSFVRLPATELLEGFADIFSDPFKGIPSIAADTAMMNTVKDVVLSVQAFYHARDSYQGWLDAMKVMATTPRGVPGVKDKFTAAYVWQTATMWDGRARLSLENASLVDKVMATLGVPRMTTQDLQAAYIDDAHETAKIDDYVTEYTRAWNLWKKSHNDAYWEQMMSLEQLPTLNEQQKAMALKKLQKLSDYDTLIEERKRRMYREWDNPAGSNFMTKLDNLERK